MTTVYPQVVLSDQDGTPHDVVDLGGGTAKYNTSPPTLSNGEATSLQTDVNGNLKEVTDIVKWAGVAVDPLVAGAVPVHDDLLLAAILAIGAGLASVVIDADGRTIAASESGSLYSNEGATAIAPFILPAAATNLRFSFYVQDADGIRVTAGAGDTIQVGAGLSAVAGKIESTSIGANVSLLAINATEWVALSITRTWTVT